MYVDLKNNSRQKSWAAWWQEEAFCGITRNWVAGIVVAFFIAVLYFKFGVNMDWVFGLRP